VMMRFGLAVLLAVGCSKDPGEPAAATDAFVDAASELGADTSSDVAVDAWDSFESGVPDVVSAADIGCCPDGLCPSAAACENPLLLTPERPLTMQDTAMGARDDCAMFASGYGGRNLYYLFDIPRDGWARVVVKPIDPREDAVFRVLSDCGVTSAESGARGGMATGGMARACIAGDAIAPRRVILAIGRYSGEAMDLTIRFDVSVETIPPSAGCSP